MAKRKDKPMTVKDLAAMGGRARAKALTAEARSAIARKAVNARWAKKKKGKVK